MLQIKEWKPSKDAHLECGHRIKAGERGYASTLFICPDEAACLFVAIKTCLLAIRTLAAQDWNPSLLTRLKASLTGK